jgi:cell division protease FtsH
VPNPDVAGREKILRVHVRKVPMAPDVDLKILARGTPGFSGADLMNLVNEAALLAARRGKRMVTHGEFEDAKDKVMMGAERKSMAMSEEEKKLTAYHEAGHAIVGLYVPAGIPVHKATIIPRGRALGMVKFLPEGDRYSMKFKEFTSQLAVAMGGRVAEEMTFGRENVTSGATGDIQQATKMAKAMVTQMGYSSELGMVAYGDNQEEVFLGMSMGRSQSVSESTAQKIDAEVKRLVDEGYADAKTILTDHHEEFVAVAEALLEFETLTGEEIRDLIAGKRPVRDADDTPHAPRGSAVPSAGKGRKRGEPDAGLEPQPQV